MTQDSPQHSEADQSYVEFPMADLPNESYVEFPMHRVQTPNVFLSQHDFGFQTIHSIA